MPVALKTTLPPQTGALARRAPDAPAEASCFAVEHTPANATCMDDLMALSVADQPNATYADLARISPLTDTDRPVVVVGNNSYFDYTPGVHSFALVWEPSTSKVFETTSTWNDADNNLIMRDNRGAPMDEIPAVDIASVVHRQHNVRYFTLPVDGRAAVERIRTWKRDQQARIANGTQRKYNIYAPNCSTTTAEFSAALCEHAPRLAARTYRTFKAIQLDAQRDVYPLLRDDARQKLRAYDAEVTKSGLGWDAEEHALLRKKASAVMKADWRLDRIVKDMAAGNYSKLGLGLQDAVQSSVDAADRRAMTWAAQTERALRSDDLPTYIQAAKRRYAESKADRGSAC